MRYITYHYADRRQPGRRCYEYVAVSAFSGWTADGLDAAYSVLPAWQNRRVLPTRESGI